MICPDLPGRGRSDWLAGPALYQPQTYVTALGALLATLPPSVYWVGTSLGGICGMVLAAQPKTPLTRLVLNDIGPLIPKAAIARIQEYMQPPPVLANLTELEALLRVILAPFGVPDDQAWAEMALPFLPPPGGRRVTLHHDPAIGEAMLRRAEPADVQSGGFWEKIDDSDIRHSWRVERSSSARDAGGDGEVRAPRASLCRASATRQR